MSGRHGVIIVDSGAINEPWGSYQPNILFPNACSPHGSADPVWHQKSVSKTYNPWCIFLYGLSGINRQLLCCPGRNQTPRSTKSRCGWQDSLGNCKYPIDWQFLQVKRCFALIEVEGFVNLALENHPQRVHFFTQPYSHRGSTLYKTRSVQVSSRT